jgi:curli production assembly/transport component CsgF
MKTLKILCVVLATLASFSLARGQDLIYQPRNPAFGGHYLNYSWLLSSASAQDNTEDPEEAAKKQGEGQLESFSESLNRQLLNQLSRQIIEKQFGETGLETGSYLLGNFQVDIVSGLDGLYITIFDISTGGQTQITIPYF